MRDKTSFFILGLLAGILSAAVFFASMQRGGGAQKKTLKLAHGLESTHPVHLAMERMKARVEELSGGALSIDIYPGGPLGDEIKCIEQLKNGSLDMTKASTASIGMFSPEIETLNLPYLFENEAHYWKVLNSPIGEKFLNLMQNSGLVGLCYYDAGARSFYTVKKEINTPEDLDGLKIRVMNSKIAIETVAALGAAPTPISSGELYTALSQGIVDGAENNFPTFKSSANGEICKFFTVDEHTRTPDVLLIGKSTWDKLSPAEREILKKAAAESSIYQRGLWKKMTEDAIAHSQKIGVKIIYPDKAAFAKKTQKIYEALEGTKKGALAKEIKDAQ